MHRITDVELLKKQARRTAAGRVLAGEPADVGLDMGQMEGCRVRIAAGYGQHSRTPQLLERDRLLWILDGLVEVHEPGDTVTTLSQGESAVLVGGRSYRLVFPSMTIYLCVEPVAEG
ncbi:MAG: hypothetical protein GX597_18530 [Anaerolineaceae bacterium]|mgnify:FL=1|nr:hypothetical protein [Anaerolineaceae bacterium]